MTDAAVEGRSVWEKFWADRDVEAIYPPVTDIVAELGKTIQDLRGMKVLEIGAGTGRTGFKLAELGADVLLLDYSVNSLKMMKGFLSREKAR